MGFNDFLTNKLNQKTNEIKQVEEKKYKLGNQVLEKGLGKENKKDLFIGIVAGLFVSSALIILEIIKLFISNKLVLLFIYLIFLGIFFVSIRRYIKYFIN